MLLASFALRGPAVPTQPYEFTQVHMGLPVRLVLYATTAEEATNAARLAFKRIAALDRMMSDYRPDSELRRLESQADRPVVVSRELFTVVQRAVEISRASGGAFDPTVAPLVALWREARRTGRMPRDEDLNRARALAGSHRLTLDPVRPSIRLDQPRMRLDLGGIAKGYILQESLAVLRSSGVTRALVESGGDIVVGDAPPGREGWTIDVSCGDPEFRAHAANLTNRALSTSGPTNQFIEIDGVRYSHVIDPRTGLGVTNPTVAHVIARDGTTADALATALTVVGRQGANALVSQFPGVMICLSN